MTAPGDATRPGIGAGSFAPSSDHIAAVEPAGTKPQTLDTPAAIREHAIRRAYRHADARALPRSLFEEIFGDPISNPNGWPIRRFGDLAKKAHDAAWPPGLCSPRQPSPSCHSAKWDPLGGFR